MQKIYPCLRFEKNATEAVDFYLSVFKNSKVLSRANYTEAGPLPVGELMTAMLNLEGNEFMILNGWPYTNWFSPAISFVINCIDQTEIDYYRDALLAWGKAEQCGWLRDKYGVARQIVPNNMDTIFSSGNQKKITAAMQAMFTMVKIDIAGIQKAFDEA